MNISDFTNKKTYSNIANSVSSSLGSVFEVNGTKIPISNGSVAAKEDQASLLKKVNQTTKILNYYAPSKIVLDTYSQLGKEIDKTLKSSFLLQTFNIKGTDILCSVFCFLVSTMSCPDRTSLHNTLANINKGAQALKSAAKGVNNLVDTFNAAANTNLLPSNVSSKISEIFGTKNNTTPKASLTNTQDTMQSIATMIATPISIVQNVKMIINALKFGLNFKVMMPDFTGKGIWDLSQNVLFVFQGMAVHAADEALRKIIHPVEEIINGIQPGICYNNLADRVRINILQTINSLKSRILKEIADIFTSNSSFNLKLRLINNRAGWQLELSAFMDALNYISANFLQIAIGCGISPCIAPPRADLFKTSDIGNLDQVLSEDSINPFAKGSSSSPTYNSQSIQDKFNNMDDLVDKFKGFMSPDNIIINDNTVKSVYNIDNNAPQQIKDFLSNGLLNNILDSSYNIDLKNSSIVYNYKRNCGE